MNRKKSSVASKVTAVILAVMMLCGILPVSGLTATDATDSTEATYSSESAESDTSEVPEATDADVTENEDNSVFGEVQESTAGTQAVAPISENSTQPAVESNTGKDNSDNKKSSDDYASALSSDNADDKESKESTSDNPISLSASGIDCGKNKAEIITDSSKIPEGYNSVINTSGINTITFDLLADTDISNYKVYFSANYLYDNPEKTRPKERTADTTITSIDSAKNQIKINFEKYRQSFQSGLVNSYNKTKAESEAISKNRAYYLWIEYKDGDSNTAVYKSKIVLDMIKPEIKITSPATSGDIYGKNVTVQFTATDAGFGIDTGSFILNGKSFSPVLVDAKKGTYKFDVTKSGTYSVSVSDKLGNTSKVAKTGNIVIDTTEPTAEDISVEFSAADTNNSVLNFLSFGLFGNNDITATVIVNSNGGSPISEITLKNKDDGVIEAKDGITDNKDGKYSKKFTLKTGSDDGTKSKFKLVFCAKDAAGNSSSNIELTDVNYVEVDEKAVDLVKGVFDEVVLTKLKPAMDTEVGVEFTPVNKDYPSFVENSGGKIFSGAGKFSLNISDTLSGIKDVQVYFDKVNGFDISKAKNITADCTISNNNFSEKTVTETTVTYKTASDLPSGFYRFFVYAENNSGNVAFKNVDVHIDNSCPVVSDITYTGNENNTVWKNEPIEVTYKVTDQPDSYYGGIKSIEVIGLSNKSHAYSPAVEEVKEKGNGTYSFKADYYQKYWIVVTDAFGRTTAEKVYTEAVKYDKYGPNIGEFSYSNNNNSDWAKSVTVSFTVDDMFTDAKENTYSLSGVDTKAITVTGVDNNKTYEVTKEESENGYKCSFVADKYQQYKVTAEDKLGNVSTPAKTVKVLADSAEPEIKSVTFSKSNSFLDYGLYNNDDITATVTVDSNGSSPISEITLKNKGDGAIETEDGITDNKDGTYSKKFTLKTGSDDGTKSKFDLVFSAKDIVGNSVSDIALTDVGSVIVDKEVVTLIKGIFDEVVLTKLKPAMDTEVGVEFTPATKDYPSFVENSSGTIYSGSGTFSLNISDTLSGIKDVQVYFDKVDGFDVKTAENVTSACTISNNKFSDEKVTETTVTYKTASDLASGYYRFYIYAKNNSGNEDFRQVDVHVDNSAPVVSDITYTGNENNTVWKNEPIEVTYKVTDQPDSYYGGIKNIEVIGLGNASNSYSPTAEEVKEKGNGTYSFKADYYQKYQIVVTDAFGRTTKEKFYTDAVKYDKYGPNIGEFSYGNNNNADWAKSVIVSFTVDDIFTDAKGATTPLSGVDSETITVTGVDNNKTYEVTKEESENGYKCSFAADKYQKYVVTAKDKLGNANVKEADTAIVKVDENNPEIVNFEFTKSPLASVLHFLTFGIYSDNEIYVTVTAKDSAPSSEINSITLYNGDKEISDDGVKVDCKADNESEDKGKISYTATKTFVLELDGTDDSFYRNLKAEAKDVSGRTSGKTALTNQNITLPDGLALVEGFDVVSTQKVPEVKNIKMTENEGTKRYGSEETNLLFSGNATLSFDVEDNISKIHSVKVTLNGTDVTEYCFDDEGKLPAQYTTFEDTADIDRKINTRHITVDTADIENLLHKEDNGEGKNTFVITATGNNGVTSKEYKYDFYLDTQNPEIVNFELTKSPLAKMLNFLTFGIYSDNEIYVTVTATDNALSTNIEEIKLYNGDTEITKINSELSTTGAYDAQFTGKKTFVLALDGTDDSFYRNLKAEATDFSGRTSEKTALTNQNITLPDGLALDEAFDVVSTQNAPEVKNIKMTENEGTERYGSEETKLLFSDDATLSFDVEDNTSKIHSVKVTLNGTDVTEYCLDDDGNSPAQYTTFEDTADIDRKINTRHITVDTADIENLLHKEDNGDGKNTFVITATGNNGVTSKEYKYDFYLDTQNPEIVNFELTKSPLAKMLNFLTFGIYSDNEIYVTVTATDNALSTNIEEIKLYNGDTEITKINSELSTTGAYDAQFTGKKTFVLALDGTDDSFYRNLKAEATDFSGRTSGKTALTNQNITLPDGLALDEAFDVVSTQNAPEVKNIKMTENEGTERYGSEETKLLFSGDATLSFDVEDNTSKLHSVKVTLNGTDVTEYCLDDDGNSPAQYTTFDNTSDKDNKISKRHITVDTAVLSDVLKKSDDGKNTFVITATGNNGVTSKEYKYDFYLDTQNPEIVNFSFDQSPLAKVLNFLTFGIYSDGDIYVTVTATDAALSTNIEEIKLYNGNEEITDVYKKLSPKEAEGSYDTGFTAKQTFVLKVDKGNSSFYNNLNAEATDFSGRKSGKTALTNKNADGHAFNEVFDVVTTTNDPVITINDPQVSDSKETRYPETAKAAEYWFTKNVVFSFNATDNVSGIGSVEVYLDGKDVTKLCKGINIPTTQKTTSLDITLDTADVYGDSIASGSHTLKVVVISNSGKKTESGYDGNYNDASQTVYVDREAPVVTKFDFSPASNIADANGEPYEVKQDTYGYYFAQATNVTITATDDVLANDIKGSGVNSIGFRIDGVDKDGNAVVNDYGVLAPVNNQAVFTIPAEFKGNIYAYAIDNVDNSKYNPVNSDGKEFTPEDVIVEDQATHNKHSEVTVETVTSTTYKDNDGNKLYNSDYAEVKITVKDTYSGIGKIDYSVTADYDTDNNYEGSLTMGKDCRTCNKTDNSKYGYTWNVDRSENNIATVMSTVIRVYNNSNAIKISAVVTDRAGYTTTVQKPLVISIDKVNPVIDVKYDLNEPNKVSGADYFKEVRKATITVTERNFNPEDFDNPITNTDGVIPELVSVSNWTTDYSFASDPDATTHTATITFSADGDYTLDCTFTDLAGRKAADYGTDKFTIDRTVPEISVEFDNNSAQNSKYYDAKRVATVTIKEHNFYSNYVDIKVSATDADNSTDVNPPAETSWSGSGDTHTATITFAKDGKYSFTVDFKDMALNDAKQTEVSTFYVDTKIDSIEISNVENETAYDGNISPLITYFDNNLDSANSSFTLSRVGYNAQEKKQISEEVKNLVPDVIDSSTGKTISYSNFPVEEVNDGIYVLYAKITDLAGNTEEKEVLFSVNRYGSTFMLGNEETENLVNNEYTNDAPDVVIKEINVNEVSDQSISLSGDTESHTLKSGEDYTIKPSGSDKKWHEYDYTILKKNFEDEGAYVVTVSSVDHFKNKVSNRTANSDGKIDRNCPVSFVVDKTEPIITIAGIENQVPYKEASREVKVVCEDANINPDSLEIYFDGELLEKDKDYTLNEDFVGGIEANLTLEADGNADEREFLVRAEDKASNSGSGNVSGFRLNAPWYIRLLHNTVAVICICAGLAVVIGLFIFIIVKKRKKGNDE